MQVETIKDQEDIGDVQAAIRNGIRGADPRSVGARDWEQVTLALRDADGTTRGGLYGATMWGWLLIDGLWVDEAIRGRGFGRQLLMAAETLAIGRGCCGAWLGTFDFQARPFYERNGYRVFAELSEFPQGHTHFHLSKRFAAGSTQM
jgi:GNAT superfamily N-acetyltransferase